MIITCLTGSLIHSLPFVFAAATHASIKGSYRGFRFQCIVIKSAPPPAAGTLHPLFMQDIPLCDFPEAQPAAHFCRFSKNVSIWGEIHQVSYWGNCFDLFGPLHIERVSALHCRSHSAESFDKHILHTQHKGSAGLQKQMGDLYSLSCEGYCFNALRWFESAQVPC